MSPKTCFFVYVWYKSRFSSNCNLNGSQLKFFWKQTKNMYYLQRESRNFVWHCLNCLRKCLLIDGICSLKNPIWQFLYFYLKNTVTRSVRNSKGDLKSLCLLMRVLWYLNLLKCFILKYISHYWKYYIKDFNFIVAT